MEVFFYCRGEMRNTPGGSSGSELRLENFVRYEISQQNSELPLYASDQDNQPLPTILKDFRIGSLFLLRRLNNCYFILRYILRFCSGNLSIAYLKVVRGKQEIFCSKNSSSLFWSFLPASRSIQPEAF